VNCQTDAIVIAKRDGSREPFQPGKLRRSLLLALQSCPCDVEQVADALAGAVAHHLRACVEPDPPSSAYVYRCACTVLRRTGLSQAARRLTAHRRQRLLQRCRRCVYDPRRPERRPVGWQKARVVAVLEGRYGLTRPVARIIAGEIEKRAFALGCRLIPKPLVSELIRSELAAWGLAAAAASEDCSAGRHDWIAGPRLQTDR
jgi:hypothetical protein